MLTSRPIETDVAQVKAREQAQQVTEMEYGHLLRIGCSCGPDLYSDDEESLPLAEPWFDAIGTRAAQDGLRVRCYLGWDMYLQTYSAAAVIMRPDGSPYANQHKRQEHEALMLADWGETLRRARSKHQATMPDYWDEELRLAERQKQEAEHAAMMAMFLRGSDLPAIFAMVERSARRRARRRRYIGYAMRATLSVSSQSARIIASFCRR